MSREAMKLSAFILMAREAHFRLSQLVQHFLISIVEFMAIGTCDSMRLMLTTRPVSPRKNA